MKLVRNWKQALKMFSVQAQLLSSAMLLSWNSLPMSLTSGINPTYVVVPVLVLGIIGRLIQQDSVDKP
jgi:hypothetical protein